MTIREGRTWPKRAEGRGHKGDLVLVAWMGVVTAATLFPFRFQANHGRPVLEFTRNGLTNVPDIVLNILLFLPIGVLLVRKIYPRFRRAVQPVLLTGAIAFAFSVLIECLQQYLPTRDSSAIDVLSNTMGALLGGFVYCRCEGHLIEWVRRSWWVAPRRVRAGALVGWTLLALVAAGTVQYGSRLSGWDPRFVLTLGNEPTGGRGWRGRIWAVELSDAAVGDRVLRDFAAGRTATREGNLISLHFDDIGHEIRGGESFPRMVWAGSERAPLAPGAQFDGQSWLQSEAVPAQIAEHILRSREFTLRVRCQSDAPNQFAGRLVAYSANPWHANLVLAQDGPDLMVRMRTFNTDEDGARIPLIVPGVFARDEIRDILVTFRHSTLQAAIARRNTIASLDLNVGTSLAGYYFNPPFRHAQLFNLAYFVFMLIPQIVFLRWLVRSRYVAATLTWVVGFALAFEVTVAEAGTRPFSGSEVGVCILAGLGLLIAIGGIVAKLMEHPPEPRTVPTPVLGNQVSESIVRNAQRS